MSALSDDRFDKIVRLLRETRERLDEIYSLLEGSATVTTRRERAEGRLYTSQRLAQVLAGYRETQERTLSTMQEISTSQFQVSNFVSKLMQDVGTIGGGVSDAFRVTHRYDDCSTKKDNAVRALVSGSEIELMCLGDTKETWTVRGWDIRKP